MLGIFDQYVSARLLDRYPQLYQLSQSGVFFRMHSFLFWILNGFYHSILLYFFSEAIFLWDLPQSDGRIAGHWVWGTALYSAALATVLGKAALITSVWTKYTVIAIPGSMIVWMLFIPAFGYAAPAIGFSKEYVNIVPRVFGSPQFWLMGLVVPVLCLLRDFAWKYAKRMYYPQAYHHVQEIQKYNIQDYRPRSVLLTQFTDEAEDADQPTGWSNSRKLSAKSGRSSACGNSAATHSRRPTNRRRGCCRHTIPRGNEAGMVKWHLRDDSTSGFRLAAFGVHV